MEIYPLSTPYIVVAPQGGVVVAASKVQAQATISNVPATINLPPIALPADPLPPGTTIQNVYVDVVYRKLSNDGITTNSLNGNQNVQIQKGAGALATCINLTNLTMNCPAPIAGVSYGENNGATILGNIDVSATVDEWGVTYGIQITAGRAALASLNLYDIQTVMRIFYSG